MIIRLSNIKISIKYSNDSYNINTILFVLYLYSNCTFKEKISHCSNIYLILEIKVDKAIYNITITKDDYLNSFLQRYQNNQPYINNYLKNTLYKLLNNYFFNEMNIESKS